MIYTVLYHFLSNYKTLFHLENVGHPQKKGLYLCFALVE